MAEGGAAEQVVVVDAGNTNTVFGIYRGDRLERVFRLSTERSRTAHEVAALLLPLFRRAGLDPEATRGMVISSVVPPVSGVLSRLAEDTFEVRPLFVEPGVRTGLPIRYDHPAEVGADRIVNAVAAVELYGAPIVAVDFGTATTFDVINTAGEYAGGIIAPGLTISAEALFAQASRLYRVDVKKPPHLVGRNTGGAMQSGIYYGYLGLVDGILERLIETHPGLKTIVATGGDAELMTEASQHIREVNPDLTLVGLKLIYERNRERR